MKQLFFLTIFLSSLLLHADPPQLSWRIANPRIIKVTQQRLEFEVQVKANQSGTYYSSGQFMLYFNNDAISSTSDLHWTVIPAGISAQTHPDIGNKYVIARVRSGSYPNVKVLIGLSPTDEAVIDEDPAAGYLAEVTTEWQTYVKIQCRILDPSAIAGISFYEAGTNGQNYYLLTAGHETGYTNPSLYEPLTLSQAYLGRLHSNSFGWTQYGGSTDNVPYINWTTSVNTSVWEGTPVIDGTDYQIQNLRIHNGASLTIESDASLTVNAATDNLAGNNGLIIESNSAGTGSLLHNTNDVDITIQRYLTGDANTANRKYHTVSVPLTASSNPLSGLFSGSYLYSFDQSIQDYNPIGASTTTPLAVDEGYLIYYPGASTTYSFAGKANNGAFATAVSYPGVGDNFNLVPNPYPSAIDWDAASGWTKTNMGGAIYMYNSTNSNSAAFVWAGYVAGSGGTGVNGGTNIIPLGQAFFVQSIASSPALTMNNSIRVHSTQELHKNTDVQEELLRLRATNSLASDEIIVRYLPEAEYTFDGAYDALKLMGGPAAPNMYSLTPDQTKVSVNSIPYRTESYGLPVGFESETEGEVTISFEGMESFGDWVTIVFEDQQTGIITDLRTSSTYTFVHAIDNNAQRFVLHFMGVTGTEEQLADSQLFSAWSNDGSVYVAYNNEDKTATVELFDLQGRLLRSKQLTNGRTLKFSGLKSDAVVLVRMTTATAISSQKVFIR